MGSSDFHPVIKEIGFDFWWNTEKLWKLDLPIEKLPISELEWYFDLPVWEYNNEEFVLKPNDVLENPEKYSEQYERILKANLDYPAEVMFLKNRWSVMDGIHRTVKSKLLGYEFINVKIFSKEHIPLIVDESY